MMEVFFELEPTTAITILHENNQVVKLAGKSGGQFLNKYNLGNHAIEHTRNETDGRIHEYYFQGPVDGLEKFTPFFTDAECIELIRTTLNVEKDEAIQMFRKASNR